MMDEFKGSVALDAGLLSSARAVEHYEIARYGILKTWAAQLGLKDAVAFPDATLLEETDRQNSFPTRRNQGTQKALRR